MDPEREAEEIARLGTWQGWAGDPDSWSVQAGARELVAHAVDVHREFFTDSWLTAMTNRRSHPYMHHLYWPLTNPGPVVRLVERSLQIDALSSVARDRLAAEVRKSYKYETVHHAELVLETAALAMRDGWTVDTEWVLPSGRVPDLHLEKGSVEYCVEISLLGTDGGMRKVTAWCHQLQAIEWSAQIAHQVMIGGHAEAEAIDGCDLEQFGPRLLECAAEVRADGRKRDITDVGLRLTVACQEDPEAPTSFTGPLTVSDPIKRLIARITDKAVQTSGGPPAWIRLDELGGLFNLTPWSQRPIEQQLGELHGALIDTIRSFPHVRGLVLSDGTYPYAVDVRDDTCWRKGYPPLAGPVALVRQLPMRRSRRTFVLPSDLNRILLPSDLELSPAHWHDAEASWLDWALAEAGWPRLAEWLIEPV
jgi:hypothetical protein